MNAFKYQFGSGKNSLESDLPPPPPKPKSRQEGSRARTTLKAAPMTEASQLSNQLASIRA